MKWLLIILCLTASVFADPNAVKIDTAKEEATIAKMVQELPAKEKALATKEYTGTIDLGTGWISVSTEDYTNAEDLTLGNGYYWDMDNIRTYTFTTYTNVYYDWLGFVTQNREAAGNLNSAFGITINPASVVRFHCDYGGNNTISQIYDDNSNHYTGSLNSKRYIRYYPYFIAPCN